MAMHRLPDPDIPEKETIVTSQVLGLLLHNKKYYLQGELVFVTILPVRKKKGMNMQTLATTRMSSRGQVVIPEDIRNRLGLEAGVQFVVVGEDDVVIFKTIQKPSMSEFDSLVRRARGQARTAGMKKSDITKAVSSVRGNK